MSEHDSELLGAYLLGVLDQSKQDTVRDHLGGCAGCRGEIDALREMEAALGGIPPEALIEGPPTDGELLLQRTIRQVRGERTKVRRQRRTVQAAAAVVTGAAVLGGGMLGGSALVDDVAAPQPAPTATTAPGTRTATGSDFATGATMAVAVQPADGWVRVRATVGGVKAGEQCRLLVVAKNGTRREAGTWRVSAQAEKAGTTIDGAALIAPPDVAKVQVETLGGQKLIEVGV
ncbi:anti-sigma factor family protein [Actinoplanes sp. GCM10030250]|uniref:anti-sigma factor family protein n=1 Tax=Actinoplanes sp. GCM10030250 TaxID=3273376 RepID=UPI003606555F